MSAPAPCQPDRLLHTIPDAARALSIGKSTVWKLIADGKLNTVRIGQSRRITHASLAKLAGDSTSKVLPIGNEG
jgi:excisionase family DNA binding protein